MKNRQSRMGQPVGGFSGCLTLLCLSRLGEGAYVGEVQAASTGLEVLLQVCVRSTFLQCENEGVDRRVQQEGSSP